MEKFRVRVIKKKLILVIQQAASNDSEQIKEDNMGRTSPITTTDQSIREEIQTFPPSNCNTSGRTISCAGFTGDTRSLAPTVLTGGPKPFQEVFQWGNSVSCVILLAPLPGSHKGQVQSLNP